MSENNKEISQSGAVNRKQMEELVPVVWCERSENDQVSLMDIVRVFYDRRRVFLMVAFLVVLVGGVFVLLVPKNYKYSAAIEIGSVGYGKEGALIDQPVSVLAKIKNSYIPEVMHSVDSDHFDFEVSAELVKDASIVQLFVDGKEDDSPEYKRVLNDIINKVLSDHSRIVVQQKQNLSFLYIQTSNRLTRLKDDYNLLVAQKNRLDERSTLLKNRIKELNDYLKMAEKTRQQAASSVMNEGKALALLMMDNDINKRIDYIAGLEEDLNIKLKNERDVIDVNMADNLRKQDEVENELKKIDIQIQNILETRALSQPIKSLRPIGLSKKSKLVLVFVIGMVAAFFAVLFMELASRVRESILKVPTQVS